MATTVNVVFSFRAGDINIGTSSPCVIYIKNPAAPTGTSFSFEITFDANYSVGIDPANDQVS